MIYIIDLFCGAGGLTEGASRVPGVEVIACVNHDAKAIKSHEANHPECVHYIEDIRTLDLSAMVAQVAEIRQNDPNAVIVLHASLECTNFSKAKGGLPRNADSRTLAEHLVESDEGEPRYIPLLKPDLVTIENVEEFMSWGPLDEKGKPVSRKNGTDYRRWVERVCSYGYEYDWRILNAADFGAVTKRKRYFAQFASSKVKIHWPLPTHTSIAKKAAKVKGQAELFAAKADLKPWRAVREVLELEKHGESIFTPGRIKSDKTFQRVLEGCYKFVAGGKKEFLVKYNSMSQSGKYVPPCMEEPCPTVTVQSRIGVANVQFMQQRHNGEPASKVASIEEPSRTITSTGGNLEVVTTQFISQQFSGHPEHKNKDLGEPSPTVKPIDNNRLVSVDFLLNYQHSSTSDSIDEPAPTVTTRDKYAFISAYYGNGDNTHGVDGPAPTIPCADNMSIVQPMPFMMASNGGMASAKVASVNEPSRVITATDNKAIVTPMPWLMNTNFTNIGTSLDEPSSTVTANRKWLYLMNPQYLGTGGSVDEPSFTLIARMDKMPPYLIEVEGWPQHLKMTPEGHPAIVVLDTDTEHCVKLKEFCALYGIKDIKMRMLFISELKQIQGFPKDYYLAGSQADQKKFIGNAVEVNVARALFEAIVWGNFPQGYLQNNQFKIKAA